MRILVLGTGPLYGGVCDAIDNQGHERALHVDEPSLDLLVLASFTRILPERIFARPRLGTLCFHPSLLPRHRGRDAVYWTQEMGDVMTGITWFWVDAGIDTGPIAIQQSCLVPPEGTRGQLYYGQLVPMGVGAFAALLPSLAAGCVPATRQNEQFASYEPPRHKRA